MTWIGVVEERHELLGAMTIRLSAVRPGEPAANSDDAAEVDAWSHG